VNELTQPAVLAQTARQIMRRHAKSFDWAARFLAPTTRSDTTLLYAFARIADDLADEPGLGSLEHRLASLARLRAGLIAPRSANALASAVAGLCQRHALRASLLDCFLGSLQADAHPRRLHTEQELLAFAYGVAGTVGLMMRPILGAPPAADPHALALGIAMQLSNVARDVAEDAARARVYVPSTYSSTSAAAADRATSFVAITRVLALAEEFYTFAEHGLHLIPRRNRRAVSVALVLYRAIGRKILRRGPELYGQGRTHLNALEKLGLIGALLLGRQRPGRAAASAQPGAALPVALQALRVLPGFPA
jgi:15-cis-phytoene synthase